VRVSGRLWCVSQAPPFPGPAPGQPLCSDGTRPRTCTSAQKAARLSGPWRAHRFLKGGRGWQNPAKAERANAEAPRELKTPDQVAAALLGAHLAMLLERASLSALSSCPCW